MSHANATGMKPSEPRFAIGQDRNASGRWLALGMPAIACATRKHQKSARENFVTNGNRSANGRAPRAPRHLSGLRLGGAPFESGPVSTKEHSGDD